MAKELKLFNGAIVEKLFYKVNSGVSEKSGEPYKFMKVYLSKERIGELNKLVNSGDYKGFDFTLEADAQSAKLELVKSLEAVKDDPVALAAVVANLVSETHKSQERIQTWRKNKNATPPTPVEKPKVILTSSSNKPEKEETKADGKGF